MPFILFRIYRLNNDLKETISSKSKQLASEIKTVNSLKVQDIPNVEHFTNNPKSTKDLIDNTKMLAECSTNTISENTDKTALPNEATDDSIANSKGDKENENKCEASTCDTHTTAHEDPKTEIGGNTEVRVMKRLHLQLKQKFKQYHLNRIL